MMTFLCKNCGYLMSNGACPIAGYSPDPNQPVCINFSDTKYTCKVCHTPVFHKQMIIDDQGNTYCDKCWDKLKTCQNCELSVNCAFNDSPDTPKMIQKQEIVGNMRSVINVRNPDIVRETCQKSCSCFTEENGCMRDFNCCDNLKPTI